jgi:hypothetical protein
MPAGYLFVESGAAHFLKEMPSPSAISDNNTPSCQGYLKKLVN